MHGNLDAKDLRILEELKLNSKQTTQQLSKKLRMPITTIHHRIKRMEKDGVIESYSLVLDHEKVGKPIAGYVLLSVSSQLPNGVKTDQAKIARLIRSRPGVESVSIVTGGTDIIVRVRVANVRELNSFLLKSLRGIDGVDKTQTLVSLQEF